MSDNYHFSDNVRVKQEEFGAEFFSISFREITELCPYTVLLGRYCVPGRMDIYNFSLSDGRKISYTSDVDTPMIDALKQLRKDLNNKNVQEMIVEACHKRMHRTFIRDFLFILENVASESRIHKKLIVLLEGLRKKGNERRIAV